MGSWVEKYVIDAPRSHGGVVKGPDKDVSNAQSLRGGRRALSQLEEMVHPSPTVMMEFQGLVLTILALVYRMVLRSRSSCSPSVLICMNTTRSEPRDRPSLFTPAECASFHHGYRFVPPHPLTYQIAMLTNGQCEYASAETSRWARAPCSPPSSRTPS